MPLLRIKVIPGAARTGLAGWMDDVLKVRIHAPPEKGKANAELLRYLGERLGVNNTAISLKRGHTSAQKTVEVTGLTLEELRSRLAD